MKFKGISRAYGQTVIYRDFSLELADNTVTAILGPSGCGKTTLLNEIVSRVGDIAISFVFQEPRLIPWRTLAQNIELALTGDPRSRQERARRYLERVGLAGRVDDYPESLSGGERQRVSHRARVCRFLSATLSWTSPFSRKTPRRRRNSSTFSENSSAKNEGP